jgi:hypothetical protein
MTKRIFLALAIVVAISGGIAAYVTGTSPAAAAPSGLSGSTLW